MRAVIIEDENSAVENLKYLLRDIVPELSVRAVIDTVADAVDFFKQEDNFDLVFMDIHLADGNSFDIFKAVTPAAPIVFVTAYDQYAIQAFKVNSIDYLMKPIQEQELRDTMQKFKDNSLPKRFPDTQVQQLLTLLQSRQQQYRQSYLVQTGDTLIPIATQAFAYFFIKDGVVRGVTNENKTCHLDGKLEEIERELDPRLYFRANRQFLIQRSAIKSLSVYFNGRLIVNTTPETPKQIIVSKVNAPKLKKWLNQT